LLSERSGNHAIERREKEIKKIEEGELV